MSVPYVSLMQSWLEKAQAATAPIWNLSLSSTSITVTEWILIGVIIFLGLLVLFLSYIIWHKNRTITRMHLGPAKFKKLAEYEHRR